MQRAQLKQLLYQAIAEYAEESGDELEIQDETRLLGKGSSLDSLGLVMIISAFEASINDTFDLNVVLADDRAMSMEKSPFATVLRLVDYAQTLVAEAGE